MSGTIRGISQNKLLGYVSLLTTVGYTCCIEYNKYKSNESKKQSFDLGSVDDMLSDNLNSGDLVLFSRRWYHNHIPMVICSKLYQTIHKTDFDHIGIVIMGNKGGEPLLYELNPFDKPTLRLFSEVVMKSESHQILLIPLSPRIEFSLTQKENLLEYARSECVNRVSFMDWEIVRVYKGLISTLLTNFIGLKNDDVNVCPNVTEVRNCYEKLDINCNSLKKLTCNQILTTSNDRIKLQCSQQSNDSNSTIMTLSFGNHLVIRTV